REASRRARPVRPATSRHALRRMTPTTPLPSDTHATPTVSKLLPICVITPAPPRRRRSRRCLGARPEHDLDSTPSTPLGTGHREVQATAARIETPENSGHRTPEVRHV